MIAFIDKYRNIYRVEPICRVLPIAPSTFYDQIRRQRCLEFAPSRVQRDEALKPEVLRVFNENYVVYGVCKIWRQMLREGFEVARCTVARFMKDRGLQGVIRGKPARTTLQDKALPCPRDKVNRNFKALAADRSTIQTAAANTCRLSTPNVRLADVGLEPSVGSVGDSYGFMLVLAAD